MPDFRVAFFLPHFAGGGAERVATALAEEYRARGAVVDFVLAQKGWALGGQFPLEMRVVDLKAPRVLFALPALVRYLRDVRPDVMFAAPNHAHIILLLAKVFSGSSVRTMLHVGNHVSTIQRKSIKFQERFYPFFLSLLQRYANAVIAVSEGVADDLERVTHLHAEKLHVIYNPIYRPEMEELMQKPLDHPWFGDGQPPVILAAGRLVEQKDYPTLIRAFASLRESRTAHLVILGEGNLLSKLQALCAYLGIAEDVYFAGFDHNPYKYMAHCSVFVLSSAWEGFANVVAEALACGAEVVATDCNSGPSEILAGGQYGRLVPVGDNVALATAMMEALTHPLPKDFLCQRGRYFSASLAAEKYLGSVGLHLP